MKADYHVHTEFSDDSKYPMELVIQDAIQKGLNEICFTDHVDYGIKKDIRPDEKIEYRQGIPLTNVDYPRYVSEVQRLKKLYEKDICIQLGLEFGMQVHTIAQYEKLYATYPFDFIILSIHQVEDKEFWNQDFQKGKTQQEYNERYYEEMYNVVQNYKNYSVLGHMDLITRYDLQGDYPFSKIKPWIEKILKVVIADGKGIEVNTSCFRYGLKDWTPSMDILKLYKELGGTIITIGSDSHDRKHLAARIDEAKDMLKQLGFTSFYTFEKMKPIAHDL